MPSSPATGYEELPYTNNAFATSHPLTLATVATLHGLQPPDPKCCRVLELGCGRGGNLLPMAESLPDGQFVGVDLSPRHIEEAAADRETLGLRNVEFHSLNLLDVGAQFGTFDYILGHGVYSWVSPEVQEVILRLCAARLAADGIAYLSYNTLPGWHYRGVVRDMLRYHVDGDASAEEQVGQARQLLEWVARDIPDQEGPRSQLILEECDLLARQADSYIYHDQLEPENHPCYFHEFAVRAAAHGFQYVAEARSEPLLASIPSSARHAISEASRDVLMACYHRDVVKVYLTAPVFCPQVSARPVASPAARLQACGDSRVTNCEHRSIDLGPLDRFLLTQMDGTRDRNALVAAMVEGVQSGRLELGTDDLGAKDGATRETALRRCLDDRAAYLAGSGFLIA